jgi:HEXXH motif-containing protein
MRSLRFAFARRRAPGPRVGYPQLDLITANSGGLEALRTAQYERRLAAVRAVLDAGADHPALAGLPPLHAAWQLLTTATKRRRAAVRDLLNHPQVGIWAAHALKRLRTATEDDPNLAGELGQAHTIAVAAAIRSGLEFTHSVPLREGTVVLPTVGMAAFPSFRTWDAAEVSGDRTGARIAAAGRVVRVPHGPGWVPMRRLRVETETDPWDLWLDDLDPYRTLDVPVAPDRLPAAEFQRWRAQLGAAWRLLATECPGIAEQLRTGLTVLVPRQPEQFPGLGSAECFGAATLALPEDPAHLAAGLVCEFWHGKLNALVDMVPLWEAGRPTLLYAPWQDDPRPVSALLPGSYAFAGVAEFWQAHRLATDDPLAHFEFALRADQVRRALATLSGSDALTAAGHQFVAALGGTVAGWGEPVPELPARHARRAAADHLVTWRLRHLRPDPASGEFQLSPDEATGLDRHPRIQLARLLLRDPTRFAALRADPPSAAAVVPGATPADVLLVAGENAAAADAYQDRLAGEPADVSSWVGLALAQEQPELLIEPERAYARYRQLA